MGYARYFVAGLAAMAVATPAAAAVTISADGKSATVGTSEAGSFLVKTQASMPTNVDLAGLNGSLLFELIGGFGTSNLTFRYTLKNISTLNNLQSSIAVFGFDVAPDATLTVLSGDFALGAPKNFNGLGQREFCLFDGSNCAGGGNDGVYVNTAANAGKLTNAVGTFRLNYGNPSPTAITFSNVTTRFQRVGINANQSASGMGLITAVPEPGQWALMIAGFALVGGAMRVRRRQDLALA